MEEKKIIELSYETVGDRVSPVTVELQRAYGCNVGNDTAERLKLYGKRLSEEKTGER